MLVVYSYAIHIILRILLYRRELLAVKHLKNIGRLVGTQVVLSLLPLAAFVELSPRKIRVRRTGRNPDSTLFVCCQVLH